MINLFRWAPTQKLLARDGKLAISDNCCCDAMCCDFTCDPPSYPEQVTLTMSWVDCDILTGSFPLDAECGEFDETPAWYHSFTSGDCEVNMRLICEQCVLISGMCYGIQITLKGAGIDCILIHLECYVVSCDPFELDVVYDTSSDCADPMHNCGCDSFSFASGSLSE